MAVLLSAALLASCDLFKDNGVRDLTAPMPSSRIKFHNFAPSSVGVNFYANDTKMTGVLTSACFNPTTAADSLKCSSSGIESATGTAYGGAGSGGRYDAITPGQYTLTAKVAGGTDVVSSVTQTIADGKYYSFFMSGPYNTATKTAEAFVIEDNIPAATGDYTAAYVRFVNAVSNGTGAQTLYGTNAETKVETAIGTAVAYKGAGAWVKVPVGTYTLSTRYSGSSTNIVTRTAVSFLGGKFYTVAARGTTATTSTLGLDLTENQP